MEKRMLFGTVFIVAVLLFVYKNFSFTFSNQPDPSQRLFDLIMSYKIDEAEALLSQMSSLKIVRGKQGESLLHRAAEMGTPKLVEMIIIKSKKPLLNSTDSHKQTPLMYAVGTHNTATVEKLLMLGANPILPDKEGDTALDKAYRYREYSLESGFDAQIVKDFDRIIGQLKGAT